MKRKRSRKLLIAISLTTLTVFSLSGCVSRLAELSEPAFVHPPLPTPAALESVQFIDTADANDRNELPDGLLLTYDAYRALRRNIIEYRREIADSRATIVMYRNTVPGTVTDGGADE